MRRLALMMVGLIIGMFALAMLIAPEWSNAPSATNKADGRADIGGAFEAIDHRGNRITNQDLLGHYSLLYFGFTYCPDICPTSLLVLADALDSLPEQIADQIKPVFVTVDPERDTAEVMGNYVRNFHPALVGITGTPEQIDRIARAYKVYYNKVEPKSEGDEYLVDHSGYLYLMSPQGEYLTHFPHNVTKQALADALRSHIADAE